MTNAALASRDRCGHRLSTYWLSGWAFLEVLEYLGTLSLVLAAVSYLSESADRIKQSIIRHARLSTRHFFRFVCAPQYASEAKRRRPQLLNEHLGKEISSVTDLLSLVDPSAVWHANDAGVPAIVAKNQNEAVVFRCDRYGSWFVVL